MHVILALPDIQSYVDRVLMFAELSRHIESLHILTRPSYNPVMFADRWGKITVHHLDHSSPIDFQRAAMRVSQRIIQSIGPANAGIIIQDIIVGRLAIPYALKKKFKRTFNVKNVISLYADNLGFVFNTLFTKQMTQYSLKAQLFYLNLYGRRLLLEYLSCRSANGITCNSPATLESLREYYHIRDKGVVLHSEIDVARYTAIPSVSCAQLGLPNDKPVLLFVGDVRLIKGIYPLLDTLHILDSRSIEFVTVFVGNVLEPDRDTIMACIDRYNLHAKTMFVGKKSFQDLLGYYTNAEVLLCPSLSEGSPRVIKEALLCGCPVIATAIPGIQMLDPTGDIIIQVPVGDTLALAEAVAHLLSNPEQYKEKARQGRQLIIENYSLETVSSNLINFYLSLEK